MGSGFFPPYVYVPSAEAGYVILVTPLGNLRIKKMFALQLAVSLAALLLSAWAWRCAANSRRKREERRRAEGESDVEEEEDEEVEVERSALEENIVKKGENSYYYAHQRREIKEDSDAVQKTMVSTYGWTDSKKTVSIYLTDRAVEGMKDDQLVLNWTKTSLSMDLLTSPGGREAKSLVIPTLFNEISDVTWKVKKDQLHVKLVKAKELRWTSLNGAAKRMEEHIEYDESLYD